MKAYLKATFVVVDDDGNESEAAVVTPSVSSDDSKTKSIAERMQVDATEAMVTNLTDKLWRLSLIHI